jgi:SPX domain protein involved in polyphosphate accumulation
MVQNTEKAVSKTKVLDKKAAVSAQPLVFRKERKYAISDVDVYMVENLVRGHPAMFSQPYPPRYVNNIYFDSSRFQSYSDNVVGAMQRKKFRIRWYGDKFGYIEKPVLEIKIKEGLAGAKRHYPLMPFTLDQGFSEKNLRDLLGRSQIPPEVKEILQHMVPTLLNQYHRKYFLSADRKFRITLDHKLTYTRIARHQNYFMRQVTDHGRVVMELKYDVDHDQEANRISDHFPFRMTKHSKYVNGVDGLDLW